MLISRTIGNEIETGRVETAGGGEGAPRLVSRSNARRMEPVCNTSVLTHRRIKSLISAAVSRVYTRYATERRNDERGSCGEGCTPERPASTLGRSIDRIEVFERPPHRSKVCTPRLIQILATKATYRVSFRSNGVSLFFFFFYSSTDNES